MTHTPTPRALARAATTSGASAPPQSPDVGPHSQPRGFLPEKTKAGRLVVKPAILPVETTPQRADQDWEASGGSFIEDELQRNISRLQEQYDAVKGKPGSLAILARLTNAKTAALARGIRNG